MREAHLLGHEKHEKPDVPRPKTDVAQGSTRCRNILSWFWQLKQPEHVSLIDNSVYSTNVIPMVLC